MHRLSFIDLPTISEVDASSRVIENRCDGGVMAETRTLLIQAYAAFNRRDVDSALALIERKCQPAQGFGGVSCDWQRVDSRLLESPMAGV